MYSTKLLNKNMVSNNAYITVGDPYNDPKANPFRQGKKGEKLNPFRVKMIPQNAEDGHFAKLTYAAGGYQETIKYITNQPLDARKRGFGTKDAHRRDEFCNDIRTEQYRETLRKEKLLTNAGSEVIKEKLTMLLAERAQLDASTNFHTMMNSTNGMSSSQRLHQYDIGRTQVTQFDPKAPKDTFYRFDTEKPGKRFGELTKPVSYDIGNDAWNINYKPPTFGGRSEVKNFYDKSHLHV